jgi:hypothetical protein
LLWDGVPIDIIDFHTTDYFDSGGIRRIGWHRDEKENGVTIRKSCLPRFDPATPDQFIELGLRLFNIIVKEEEADATGQLRIP